MQLRKSIYLLLFCFFSQAINAQQPNVIIILADDLGWNNVSCYGNKYLKTPNIDRIAEEGVKFTQAYVTPQCTPTRASLMTGQSTAKLKLWHVIPKYEFPYAYLTEPNYSEFLSSDKLTIGDVMKNSGYRTAFFGKWHLTNYETGVGYYTRLFSDHAASYGFDEVEQMTDPTEYQKFSDKGVDFLTDESIAFIERNKQRPFFLMLSHHTIHGKVLAPEELVKKYESLAYPANGQQNATYLAALEHFDNSVGRILKKLDDEKLADNTVVIFLSDNGGVDTEFDNEPLRNGKGSLYEGGIRVPFVLRYPKAIKAGKVSDELVQVTDILPTLADIAELQSYPSEDLDGISIWPLAVQNKELPDRSLFWYAPLYDIQWGASPAAVIRKGKFKLIHFFGDYIDLDKNSAYTIGEKTELYDIENDVSEKLDLSGSHPKILKSLKAELFEWMKKENLTFPVKNPNYDVERAFERGKK